MKKVFSLALVAGMFVFASCETKTAETTETETVETVETTEPTTLEGDSAAATTTTEVTTDSTAAPVQ